MQLLTQSISPKAVVIHQSQTIECLPRSPLTTAKVCKGHLAYKNPLAFAFGSEDVERSGGVRVFCKRPGVAGPSWNRIVLYKVVATCSFRADCGEVERDEGSIQCTTKDSYLTTTKACLGWPGACNEKQRCFDEQLWWCWFVRSPGQQVKRSDRFSGTRCFNHFLMWSHAKENQSCGALGAWRWTVLLQPAFANYISIIVLIYIIYTCYPHLPPQKCLPLQAIEANGC